jgi:ketosteroid isomerase-like protein
VTGDAAMNPASDLLAKLADAYNRHDLDGIRALYAPDATINDTNVDEALATHERFFTFLPDAKVDLRAAAAEDAVLIAEMTLHGTNTGPLPLRPVDRAILDTTAEVLPPTGRTVAIPVVIVIEVDGGRIVTERQHLDSLTLLGQLGLLPAA